MKMQIFLKGKKKPIGEYKDNTFYTTRDWKKHILKTLNAWGIDAELLDKLVARDAQIVIKEKHSSIEYKASAKFLKEKGIVKVFGTHGRQVFLPLPQWQTEEYRTLFDIK